MPSDSRDHDREKEGGKGGQRERGILFMRPIDHTMREEGGGERERERRKYNRKVEEKYRDTRIPKN